MIDSENQSNPLEHKNVRRLYDRYTSTSVFTPQTDANAALQWSNGYFRSNYAPLLPDNKAAKILEIGCGYGRYIHTLADMGYTDCYGIDLSREQIEYAREKLHLKNVEQGDALAWLGERPGVYDYVLALDILEHLPTVELMNMCMNIRSALKPGGFAIFQVPNALSPLNPIIYGDLTHVRAFTPQSMQQLMLYVDMEPLTYIEIPPYVGSVKSAVQRLIWSGLIRPLISLFFKALHGNVVGGGIFSSNLIVVAQKRQA
jgi:2-polyprenyl-3-methyl-5-hydroxy-6-metoxy-1,4-benzoquinol methylase